ncbi:MAG: hypothetical protein ACE5I3_09215 [Phycisphaerae bacterium]
MIRRTIVCCLSFIAFLLGVLWVADRWVDVEVQACYGHLSVSATRPVEPLKIPKDFAGEGAR